MKRILLISGFILCLFFGVDRVYRKMEVEGFKNIETCKNLSSGISQGELIEKLGQPLATYNEVDYKTLIFKAPPLNGAMIQTKISLNGVVQGVKCFEHDPWK